jgi:hypothetical protein
MRAIAKCPTGYGLKNELNYQNHDHKKADTCLLAIQSLAYGHGAVKHIKKKQP